MYLRDKFRKENEINTRCANTSIDQILESVSKKPVLYSVLSKGGAWKCNTNQNVGRILCKTWLQENFLKVKISGVFGMIMLWIDH